MTRSPFHISGFTTPGSTSYPCPSCGTPLEVAEEDVKTFETLESARFQTRPESSAAEIDLRFTARLKCPSKACATDVMCVGAASYDQVPIEDPYGNITGWDWECFYNPHFFYPNLRMAKIPPGCPATVKNRLEASFAQFYFSVNGALNELRGALEALLDAIDVPRQTNEGKRLVLHDRIEKIPESFAKFQNLFMAMRVLGNSGTHVDDGFERRDLLVGYELMEAVLQSIYPSEDPGRIHELAENVLAKEKARRAAARNL